MVETLGSLEQWILNVGENLAGAGREWATILGDAELEVAVLAPLWAPGVADLEVLGALVLIVLRVLTITDEGNGVVDLCAGAVMRAVTI